MNFEPITRFNQNNKNKRPQDAFYVGPHLDPTGIRRVLAYLDGATFKVEGRQEDAEEFLSHLLNGLHDEMIKVKFGSNQPSVYIIFCTLHILFQWYELDYSMVWDEEGKNSFQDRVIGGQSSRRQCLVRWGWGLWLASHGT